MHRIALCFVLLLAAVSAATAADNPTPGGASALCTQQKAAMGSTAFTSLYGGRANAYGRCVSRLAGTLEGDNANAAKECASERADASFADSHDGKTFDQFYGTGHSGANAFGKCVSSKSQELEQKQQESTISAAKACKAERTQLGSAAFTKKYGGNSNAFGRCVAKTARAGR